MWKVVIFLSFFVHIVYCYEVTPVSSAPRTNDSAGLIWDKCSQSMFYTDFFTTGNQKCIFRYDYNKDRVYGAYIDKCSAATFILPIDDCDERTNRYAVGCDHAGIIVEWDGVSEMAEYKSTLFTVQEDDPTMAMDVARQSLQGHLYGSTYHPTTICSGAKNATAFKYTKENGVQQIDDGQIMTSGWAFDDNAGKVYRIDSCAGIFSYDADCDSNCEATRVLDLNGSDRCLLSLDSNDEGQLFSCSYINGSIWQIDPTTNTANEIASLPQAGCSGVAFGGPNEDILFALQSSTVIDPENPKDIIENYNLPSLYKVTGLGFTGASYKSLNLD